MREARTIARDVEVTAVPYGDRMPLTAGTTVYLVQSLGGAHTLLTDMGYMVRLDGADAATHAGATPPASSGTR